MALVPWTPGLSASAADMLLLAFHERPDFSGEFRLDEDGVVEIQASATDFGHICAHLPFDLESVEPWLPDKRTSPPKSWAVMRQDDNGHVFEVHAHSSNCGAERELARLEALTHKQTYWIVDLLHGEPSEVERMLKEAR